MGSSGTTKLRSDATHSVDRAFQPGYHAIPCVALGAKAYALGGEPALDTCRSSDTETLSAKPFWNSDFVQHHLNMMVELVYKVTAMIALEAPNGLVKVRSPCVVVPKCSNRMKNRFLVERHIAQLGPFCYPVR